MEERDARLVSCTSSYPPRYCCCAIAITRRVGAGAKTNASWLGGTGVGGETEVDKSMVIHVTTFMYVESYTVELL